jgi:hypothetical protein
LISTLTKRRLGALLSRPAIIGLTESLTNFEPDGVANEKLRREEEQDSSLRKIRRIVGFRTRRVGGIGN